MEKFLGVWGILNESIKLLVHNARLLLSLAAILVLPLWFVILGHPLVTNPLLARMGSKMELFAAKVREGSKTERELHSEIGLFVLLLLIYFVVVLAFLLVSTATIVYSVACIYLEETVTLSKILAVVPRVWKRLMVTFLWKLMVIFVVVVLLVAGMGVSSFVPLVHLLGIAFLAYISVVWYLANAITILEERYGIDALRESARIVKGKRLVGFCLILIDTLCTGVIGFIFQAPVVNSNRRALLSRLLLGLLLVLALSLVHLIGIIMHGLFYFLVKSYHKESIDRMVLWGAYLGDYAALKDPEAL